MSIFLVSSAFLLTSESSSGSFSLALFGFFKNEKISESVEPSSLLGRERGGFMKPFVLLQISFATTSGWDLSDDKFHLGVSNVRDPSANHGLASEFSV